MKYYIVLRKDGSYRGFTTIKEVFEDFTRQRNMKDFEVCIMNKKDMEPRLLQEINSSYTELVPNSGLLMFPDEEEYFIEGFNQYLLELKMYTSYLLKDIQYIEFQDNEERDIVIKTIKIIYQILKDIEDGENSDACVEYDRYFKMKDMVQHIINQF